MSNSSRNGMNGAGLPPKQPQGVILKRHSVKPPTGGPQGAQQFQVGNNMAKK